MAFDILSFLHDFGIAYDTRVNRGWANIQCPHCEDRSKNGGWNLAGGYFHCWRCGGHNREFTLSKMLNLPSHEIEQLLIPYNGRQSLLDNLNRKSTKTSIAFNFDPLTKKERKYLKSRNFDPDHIQEKYKVASGGIVGTWAFRIIIPFFFNNQLVTYQGRDVTGESNMRYKNLSIEESVVNPKHLLYNIDNCPGPHAYIFEGVTDVWRFGDGFISTQGTSIDPAQLKTLAKKYKSVTFLFDPEAEAQRKAKKYASQLSAMGVNADLIDLELDHDPGDCTEDEVFYITNELKSYNKS